MTESRLRLLVPIRNQRDIIRTVCENVLEDQVIDKIRELIPSLDVVVTAIRSGVINEKVFPYLPVNFRLLYEQRLPRNGYLRWEKIYRISLLRNGNVSVYDYRTGEQSWHSPSQAG